MYVQQRKAAGTGHLNLIAGLFLALLVLGTVPFAGNLSPVGDELTLAPSAFVRPLGADFTVTTPAWGRPLGSQFSSVATPQVRPLGADFTVAATPQVRPLGADFTVAPAALDSEYAVDWEDE